MEGTLYGNGAGVQMAFDFEAELSASSSSSLGALRHFANSVDYLAWLRGSFPESPARYRPQYCEPSVVRTSNN